MFLDFKNTRIPQFALTIAPSNGLLRISSNQVKYNLLSVLSVGILDDIKRPSWDDCPCGRGVAEAVTLCVGAG